MTGNMEGLILDLDEIDLEAYAPLAHEIVAPLAAREALTQFFLSDPDQQGAWLPFGGSHQMKFRPQETTIWHSGNFTGKSQILLQSAVHWMRGNSSIDEKVLLISPEMSIEQSLARMIRLMTAKIPGQVTEAEISSCLVWLTNKFWQYSAVGQVEVDDLVNVIRYATTELGITQVIIDNLSVLSLNGADSNRAQADLMAKFVQTSRTHNCHVHLIAHDRKPGPGEGSSRYNISGSGALSNLADNCISVGRNYKKAEKLADITLSEEDRREVSAQSDGKIVISKQRHGPSWTGTVKLFFSPYSMRFSEDRNSPDLAIPEIQELADLGEPNSRGYAA